MAEGEITVRELRGASENSTVQIWRDHSHEHLTLWLPRYSFTLPLDLSRGPGFLLSLLRWPGCHEAVSCFGALLPADPAAPTLQFTLSLSSPFPLGEFSCILQASGKPCFL